MEKHQADQLSVMESFKIFLKKSKVCCLALLILCVYSHKYIKGPKTKKKKKGWETQTQIRNVSLQNLVIFPNDICYLTQEKYLMFQKKN